MRILFSCLGAYGHVHPLVPLARSLAEQEHEIAFATAAPFKERIQALGFRFFEAGISQAELGRRWAPYLDRLHSLPIGERRPFAYRWRFGEIDSPARLPGLRAAAEAWRPSLLVHDSAELAAPLVAAERGLPSVHHAFGRLIPPACLEAAGEQMEPHWRAAGIEPEALCGMYRGQYVDICPPSFQTERPPAGTTVRPLRPLSPPAPGETPPEWVDELRERRLVYVTLGTVHGTLAVFRTLLDALETVDCRVVATVGPTNDPAHLAPVPPNARVERYVAQAFLLPACAVVVAQAGSGSTFATLAHGVPSLLVPQGADQFDNAAQLVALGAGLRLLPDAMTEKTVRDAVVELLDEPSYAASARRLAGEIAAMPHPDAVAPAIAAVA